MLISIISGTYNRLPLLSKMIESVRAHVHYGLTIEYVIVDGGSTDGTIEWCKSQPDIRLLEHGALKGGILAFTEGAYAAQGKYIWLANDDVEVVDYSLLSAIAYLEDNPTCGAVAFADDRPAQSKPNGYHVQTMTVRSVEGEDISIPYAQVGLYRRWLGDLCGWWGAYDPEFKSHTYGGDNYLTARIIEYGYSVDAVQSIRVKDLVYADMLREMNQQHESANIRHGGGYYQRYPTPPQMRDHMTVSNPDPDPRGRVLYLPIFESSYPHHRVMKRGLREALMRRYEVIEVDYNNEPYDLPALVNAWQPDILFLQCQRGLVECLPQIRRDHPEILILNWNGDVYLDALIDPVTMQWLKNSVDVQLCVNGAALPVYEANGVKAAYWQCGWEPVNESVIVPPDNAPDIVFMGSAYVSVRGDLRRQLADVLTALPYKVHLVGTGWVNYPDHNEGNTTYQFEVSNAIRRAAKIEVGDNQYPNDTGFVSNRIFDCLAAGGALLLHQRIDRLEEFTGLKADVHYIEWEDFADLQDKIAYWMDARRDKKRAKIVKQAYDYVRTCHSFDARLRELFGEIILRLL